MTFNHSALHLSDNIRISGFAKTSIKGWKRVKLWTIQNCEISFLLWHFITNKGVFRGKRVSIFYCRDSCPCKNIETYKKFIKLKKNDFILVKKLESEIRNGWLLEIKNYSVLDLRTKIEIISQRSNQIAWKIKYHGSEIKKRQQIQEFWKCQVILIG